MLMLILFLLLMLMLMVLLMLNVDVDADIVTLTVARGFTHFGAYHRPLDGHFYRGPVCAQKVAATYSHRAVLLQELLRS